MGIQLIETDQNWQEEATVYWFSVDGVTWGLRDQNGMENLLDSEGYPVDECNALPGLLSLMAEAITRRR